MVEWGEEGEGGRRRVGVGGVGEGGGVRPS